MWGAAEIRAAMHTSAPHADLVKRRYGERKAIVESPDWEGPALHTCQDYGWVARAFETSRRREVLSFKHHREALAIENRDDQDRILRDAENSGASSSCVRQRAKEYNRNQRQIPPENLPALGTLGLLPW